MTNKPKEIPSDTDFLDSTNEFNEFVADDDLSDLDIFIGDDYGND